MECGWRTRPRLNTICSQIKSPVPGMGYFSFGTGAGRHRVLFLGSLNLFSAEIRVYRM